MVVEVAMEEDVDHFEVVVEEVVVDDHLLVVFAQATKIGPRRAVRGGVSPG